MEVRRGFAELIPILSLIESPNRFKRSGWRQRRPLERNDILFRQFDAAAILEWNEFFVLRIAFIFQRTECLRDDRSMARASNGDRLCFAAGDLESFLAGRKVHPFAVDLVLIRVVGIHFFDVQVHHIGTDIRKTPCDLVVMTDHNARHARKREPRYFERAGCIFFDAMQGNLKPDRRHLYPKMRIVGKIRHSGVGQLAGDRPRVGADSAAPFAERRVE